MMRLKKKEFFKRLTYPSEGNLPRIVSYEKFFSRCSIRCHWLPLSDAVRQPSAFSLFIFIHYTGWPTCPAFYYYYAVPNAG